MSALPIAISLGDPAGVGPEIVVRALAERPELDVLVFGDGAVLARAAAVTNLTLPPRAIVIPVTTLGRGEAAPGAPDAAGGRAQVAYLEGAVDAALGGRARALVTAPISKAWASRAGFSFPGHTEYLAARAGVAEFAMMLAGPRLRVTLATTHLPLAAVPAALSITGIASAIAITGEALLRFGVGAPRVAVAALNPHAGEEGLFGDEEARLIRPAIEAAERRLGEARIPARVSGPHVPDAVFRQAVDGVFDAVVAMYHDQALVPLKLVDFEDAVNVTLGLPFVRTSPDHGTAYDLAGTGRARHRSFAAALDLADRLSRRANG